VKHLLSLRNHTYKFSVLIAGIFVAISFLMVVLLSAAESRDWQTVDGKLYKGTLLLLSDDGKVKIYDDNDHKPIELKFDFLCEEDQEYVKTQANPFQIEDTKDTEAKKVIEAKFAKINWQTPVEVMQIQVTMGNADACAWLGFLYEEGEKGLTKDANNSKFCYEKGAKLAGSGSLAARYCVAKLVKDANEMVKIADKGFVLAQYDASQMAGTWSRDLISGRITVDDTRLKYMQAAAKQGLPAAEFKIGLYNIQTSRTYPERLSEGTAWFRKAAEHQNSDAEFGLARLFLRGVGVDKDSIEALRWLKKAMNNGRLEDTAMSDNSGLFGTIANVRFIKSEADFLSSVLIDQGFTAETMAEIRRRADANDADFVNILGDCYFYGIGGPKKNAEKAVELYQRAVDNGCGTACNDLGDCYWEGNGVKQDKEKAIELYNQAAAKGYYAKSAKVKKRGNFGVNELRNRADRGSAEDKYKLGMRFLHGDKEIVKDKTESIVWLQKAAYQDDSEFAAEAAYRLGDLVESQKGLKHKFVEGVAALFIDPLGMGQLDKQFWMQLAASKGHSGAIKWLKNDVSRREQIVEEAKEDDRAKRILEDAIRDAIKK
jgi:TPR repeat protein